jgi:uncharacterized oxidoreductase
MNLTGNAILLTGGSTGIGFTLAAELLQRGNRVLVCGRRETRLNEARQKLPALETLVCNVALDSERRRLAEWAIRTAPMLNMLVNNAGVQHRVDLLHGDESSFRGFEEIDINFTAPVHLSACPSGSSLPDVLRVWPATLKPIRSDPRRISMKNANLCSER